MGQLEIIYINYWLVYILHTVFRIISILFNVKHVWAPELEAMAVNFSVFNYLIYHLCDKLLNTRELPLCGFLISFGELMEL